MGLFDSLTQEHRDLLQKLQLLVAAEISEPEAFTHIFDNLLFHMEIEESILYPPLKLLPKTKQAVENAIKAHIAIRYLIKALFQNELKSKNLQKRVEIYLDSPAAQEAINELFQGKLEYSKVQNKIAYLQEAVKLHFSREEKELFSQARMALPVQEQQSLQEAMQQAIASRKEEQSV